jgi:hypothetical protein
VAWRSPSPTGLPELISQETRLALGRRSEGVPRVRRGVLQRQGRRAAYVQQPRGARPCACGRVGARRAQWGRPRARRVPPVARSARRSAERAAAPRGRAYVCVRPAAAVPPLRRSHHPPGAVAQPVVRACSGGCWTFCNEFRSRARVCHPPSAAGVRRRPAAARVGGGAGGARWRSHPAVCAHGAVQPCGRQRAGAVPAGSAAHVEVRPTSLPRV